MGTLKEFMLLFRMEPIEAIPTTEEIAIMQKQWGTFIGSIASQGKLVNVARLDFEGVVITANQSTENKIFVETNLIVSGNLTLKAASIEEATETAKNCPILFIGGIVEIRPIIPMN